MKNNYPTAILALALTLSSMTEFLDAYPVSITTGKNELEISKDGKNFYLPMEVAADKLDDLFSFLNPDDAESIAIDWSMHVEREIAIAGETANVSPKLGRPRLEDAELIEFAPESREAAIIEFNNFLPEPPAEIFV